MADAERNRTECKGIAKTAELSGVVVGLEVVFAPPPVDSTVVPEVMVIVAPNEQRKHILIFSIFRQWTTLLICFYFFFNRIYNNDSFSHYI